MDAVIRDGLAFSLPLFIIAVGGIYSEKSGITNLALEGLQGFGAFAGALTAVLAAERFGRTSQLPYNLALLAAMLGGLIFSMIHAVLCIRFRANMVISGVVVNILAMALTEFLTKRINTGYFKAPSDRFVLGVSQKITIPVLSQIPIAGAMFTNMYVFETVIAVIAVFAWFVLDKSRFGLRLRACGENPHAVDAAGIQVGKVRLAAVLISGALSGLGGISFAYSVSANFSPAIYAGYGYLAIASYIFGNWKILPTFFACLIFGFARSGGYKLVQILGMPGSYQDIVMILPYALTLFLLVFFSKKNRAPGALGTIYDRGAR